MTWQILHASDCPVTAQRAALLVEIAEAESAGDDQRVASLRGAEIEYDLGGDQEAEECRCGRYNAITVQITAEQAEALHALIGDALDDDHEAEGLDPESTLAARFEDERFAEKLVAVAAAMRGGAR